MTRIKLILVRLVIVAMSIVIFVAQWRSALHPETFGSQSFNPGVLAQVFRAVVMAGIPMIFFAVGAYLLLLAVAFRRGEIEEHRARQRVKAVRRSLVGTKGGEGGQPSQHDYVK